MFKLQAFLLFTNILLLIISINSHAQVLQEDKAPVYCRGFFYPESEVLTFDFNGNGADDWIVVRPNFSQSVYPPFVYEESVVAILTSVRPGIYVSPCDRSVVKIIHRLQEDDFAFTQYPLQPSGTGQSSLLCVSGTRMIAIHHDPLGVFIREQYRTTEYVLNVGHYLVALEARIGWFYGSEKSQDLFLLASNGSTNQAFLFPDIDRAETNTMLEPVEIYPFPLLESRLFSGSVDSAGKDVLFFQSESRWHVWIPGSEQAFQPDRSNLTFSVEIPDGIVQPVDVNFRPDRPHPITIGLETEPRSPLAYAAFGRYSAGIDWMNPIYVGMDEKTVANPKTRLFDIQAQNQDKRILILEFPPEAPSQPGNRFWLYEVTDSLFDAPVLQQEIAKGEYYPDRPMLHAIGHGFFNGDDSEDILFLTGSSYSPELGGFLALFGQTSTGILEYTDY